MRFDPKPIIKTIPHLPGIYRMSGVSGDVLYIGKAKDLKKRVASYFNKTQIAPRTQMMVAQIADIQVTVTNTEAEALLLENNLIKSQKPRYNILFRDDTSYPYIALSGHQFARLSFHRGVARTGTRVFGPFPSTATVRESIQLLQKMFRLRVCVDSVFTHRNRPCLEHQIGRCTAPCVGLIDATHYAQDVRDAVLFLEGKAFTVIDLLAQRMEAASQQLAFEEAGVLRDRIQSLRQVQTRQFVSNSTIDNADVVVCVEYENKHCVNLVMVRGGRHLGDASYFPQNSHGATLEETTEAFLMQHYTTHNTPPLIISQHIKHIPLLQLALSKQTGCTLKISHRALGDHRIWLKAAQTNAHLALQQRLAGQKQQHQRFMALCAALNLASSTTRMECFDVSHTMGEATVASCVVFDRGDMQHGEYRRYNIQNAPAGDDYSAMREVLERRYTKRVREAGVLPHLILVDGGRGQINVAIAVMQKLGLTDIPLVGIAKGEGRKAGLETLILAESGQSIQLPHDHSGFHLLQHIRDEAHRFAISGHRAKRASARKESLLEKIDGIGVIRRRALLVRFGGLNGVKSASIEELEQVTGVSRKLAEKIYETLHH